MSRGRDTASFPLPRGRAAKILLQRKLSYRRRPLTTLRVLPSIAGADKQSRSRDAPHPSHINKRHESHEIRPFFLRLTDREERRKRNADRRRVTTSAPEGAARARRSASPIGVPPRLSPEGRRSQRLSSRPRFLGRRSCGCYPPLPCPSPVTAPHAPAVVPARKMPGAARDSIKFL